MRFNYWRIIMLSALFGLLSTATAETAIRDSRIDEYDNLWWQYDLKGSEKVLDGILKDDPRQPEALRRKAFVQYYYHQDYPGALQSIHNAIEAEPTEAKNYSVQGDIQFSQADYQQAARSYSRAIELDSANADYYLSLAKSYIQPNKKGEAKHELETAVQLNPYLLEANNLLHTAYIEDGEYEKAYHIWKTKYLFDESGTSSYCPKEWNTLYQSAISHNSQGPGFHLTMGQLYERLLLYDEAKMEFEKARQQDTLDGNILQSLEKTSKFIHFREALKDTAIAFYRQQAVQGRLKEKDLLPRLIPIYTEIASLFPDVRNPKKYNNDWLYKVNSKVEEYFHVIIHHGYIDGYWGSLFGYVTLDTMREISQWGKTGKLQMVVLKNMVTNGFNTWYWNNGAANGGWTTSGDKAQANKFVVVLDPKYGAAWHRWEMAIDKRERDKLIARDVENSKGFIDRPPLDVFYSSWLKHQLMLKAMDEAMTLYKDHTPEKHKSAFIRYLFAHYCETSTVIHEGQHALDSRHWLFGFRQWKLEHRAKLSEINYGGMPLLSLSDILSREIGNEKLSHGRAATKVFSDISRHILKNKAQYPGINAEKNIMMQLCSLDSKAVREIANAIFQETYK